MKWYINGDSGELFENGTASSFATQWHPTTNPVKIATKGRIHTRGVMNYEQTGTTPTGIVFGDSDNATTPFGNNQISFMTAGQRRLYIGDGGNIIMQKNLTVQGDLTVQGTLTAIDTTNTSIKDTIIELNSGLTDTLAPTNDSGIIINRGNENNAFMGWDESSSKFRFSLTSNTANDTGDLDLSTLADIEAGNISSNGEDLMTKINQLTGGAQPLIVGAAVSVTQDKLTPNLLVVSDANGDIATSNIGAFSLTYLDGVTSNIQQQINNLESPDLSANRILISNEFGEMRSHPTLGADVIDGFNITTIGVAEESKFLKVDSNRNISNLNNVEIRGQLEIAKDNGHPRGTIIADGNDVKLEAPSGQFLFEDNIKVRNGSNIEIDSGVLNIADGQDNTTSANLGYGVLKTLSGQNFTIYHRNLKDDANSYAFLTNSFGDVKINSSSDSSLFFQNQGVTKMIMNKDGELGIGTNNPNKKLHIEGDIKVSGDLYTGSKTISLANLEDLTGKVQTQLDSKQPTITGALTSFASSNATVDRVIISNASGKLSVSDITSTELGYLDGVTSNIQTQLNSKISIPTGAITTVLSDDLDFNRAIISNGSGKLSVSDITSTELGYLDGVTSNIQSQISNIGTNGAISTVLSNNLNQDRAIISNASGKLAASSITSTELGYLDGVTSNLQLQLNNINNSAWSINSNDIYFNSGRVGINTDAPLNKLHISGTNNIHRNISSADALMISGGDFNAGSALIGIDGTTSGQFLAIQSYAGDSNNAINNSTYGNISLNSLGGNVGIGITNPSKKFEVAGDIKLSGSLFTGANSVSNAQLGYLSNVTSDVQGQIDAINVNGAWSSVSAGNIRSDNNVGIKTDPTKALDVIGQVQAISTGASLGHIFLNKQSANNTVPSSIAQHSSLAAWSNLVLSDAYATGRILFEMDWGSYNAKWGFIQAGGSTDNSTENASGTLGLKRITGGSFNTSGGKFPFNITSTRDFVGINTTTPSYQLHVV